MKRILLVVHPTRPAAAKFANELAEQFSANKYEILSNYPALVSGSKPIENVTDGDFAIVLGGDGTILRAA